MRYIYLLIIFVLLLAACTKDINNDTNFSSISDSIIDTKNELDFSVCEQYDRDCQANVVLESGKVANCLKGVYDTNNCFTKFAVTHKNFSSCEMIQKLNWKSTNRTLHYSKCIYGFCNEYPGDNNCPPKDLDPVYCNDAPSVKSCFQKITKSEFDYRICFRVADDSWLFSNCLAQFAYSSNNSELCFQEPNPHQNACLERYCDLIPSAKECTDRERDDIASIYSHKWEICSFPRNPELSDCKKVENNTFDHYHGGKSRIIMDCDVACFIQMATRVRDKQECEKYPFSTESRIVAFQDTSDYNPFAVIYNICLKATELP